MGSTFRLYSIQSSNQGGGACSLGKAVPRKVKRNVKLVPRGCCFERKVVSVLCIANVWTTFTGALEVKLYVSRIWESPDTRTSQPRHGFRERVLNKRRLHGVY